jgi:hypothetical protein
MALARQPGIWKSLAPTERSGQNSCSEGFFFCWTLGKKYPKRVKTGNNEVKGAVNAVNNDPCSGGGR